jgi:nicotinamidase-related amidase
MATVLLVLDVQNGVIDRLEKTEPYLERLASTITSARKANVKIIHVITGFRPGYPENHPNNSSVPSVVARGEYLEGHSSVQVHPAIAPAPGEVVLTKRRVSAFFATELDMLLRCANAESIVVSGLITSGAVLSTVRQAMDMDYRITVLEDCCMDRNEELHRVLMEKVFAHKTDVASAKEWVGKLSMLEER